MRLMNSIKVLAFWGIVFLNILILGFQVKIQDIWSIACSLKMPLSAFCIDMLVSVFLYPILTAIWLTHLLKGKLSFGEILVIGFQPLLWMPYKGLDIKELIGALNETDAKVKIYDLGVWIYHVVEMLIWWFVVLFGIYTIYHQKDNALFAAIEQTSSLEKVKVLIICIIVYVVIRLLAWAIYEIDSRKQSKKIHSLKNQTYTRKRNKKNTSKKQSGTRAQKYYDRHPEHIPSACSACGGPYPECRDSCNLFDD